MFNKSKGWISGSGGGGVFKPKNPHSLEHLKYLYGILCKNQTVTDQNLSLLVETLRSISEILIWGDQNDSSVFDFFLEKNMLVFFLKFMRQKSAQCICVQLLQTLNILFDNITNKTSVYYLLSNNHINSIIIHKFDFSDEEVMAYYISFLKTLSMKLNKHTIHFFYNEHTNDFALYTEAIKFFNHPESMVRIAVRTITLNVYRACVPLSKMEEGSEQCFEGKSMIHYIKEKTAAPYFSNLVKFIGQHVVELNATVRQDNDHSSKGKLADLVAEHLDHLHYLNDILCLDIEELNETLTEHLLNSLFVPLYMDSLLRHPSENQNHSPVDQVISLFLLSQVFLIIHHPPLVRELVDVVMRNIDENADADKKEVVEQHQETDRYAKVLTGNNPPPSPIKMHDETNSTDEEKLMRSCSNVAISLLMQTSDVTHDKPYLSTIAMALDCSKDDYRTLLALCLQYALNNNKGIDLNPLEMLDSKTEKSGFAYNTILVRHLIRIMSLACQNGSKVRLATLELSVLLLKSLVRRSDGRYVMEDEHLAAIEGVREEATLLLRSFYKVWQKSEEIFLDMFEDEHRELKLRPLNVEHLVMDASILLPPIGTPLTGVDFGKRLPCGEVERARKAIRSFFILRDLSFTLRQEVESNLPLTKESECVKVNDVLDLNNSDLIACTIVHAENKKERRFLVIDVLQLILVEPESKRLGWGIVKFVGFLQDTEVMGDKDDSRSLLVTIHRPSSSSSSSNSLTRPFPILSSKFIFDDHIRCMAARQRLTKGRLKARQRKMQMIARMLDMPSSLVDSIYVGPSSQEIGGRLGRDCGILRPSSASSHAFLPGQAQRRRGVIMRDDEGRSQLMSKKNLIPMTELDPLSHQTKESLTNSNTSRTSSSSSSSSIKRSIFASVDQVPAFTMVASEQEHEKRSRKLKAKLSESIARHQQNNRSSSFSPDASALAPNMSPTSDVKKKMFLSMAKEAKQRQQGGKTSTTKSFDQSENATHMELVQLNQSELPHLPETEIESPHESRRSNSPGPSSTRTHFQPTPKPRMSDLSGGMGGRSCSPRIVARLRSRANSESGGKNLEVKGQEHSEERRFSGSLLSKNVFTSLLSPLVQRSPPRGGQRDSELKDDSLM